jgi:hypothetical protein
MERLSEHFRIEVSLGKDIESDGKIYTLYGIKITDIASSASHEINRRYSEFHQYYKEIKAHKHEELTSFTFPAKQVFNKNSDATKAKRRAAFENLLKIVMDLRPIPENSRKFLNLNNAPYMIKSGFLPRLSSPLDKSLYDSAVSGSDDEDDGYGSRARSTSEGEDDTLTSKRGQSFTPSSGNDYNYNYNHDDNNSTTAAHETSASIQESKYGSQHPPVFKNLDEDDNGASESADAFDTSSLSPLPFHSKRDDYEGNINVNIKHAVPKGRRPSMFGVHGHRLSGKIIGVVNGSSDVRGNRMILKPSHVNIDHTKATNKPMMIINPQTHTIIPLNSTSPMRRWVPQTQHEKWIQKFNIGLTPQTPYENDSSSSSDVIADWLINTSYLRRRNIGVYLATEGHENILQFIIDKSISSSSSNNTNELTKSDNGNISTQDKVKEFISALKFFTMMSGIESFEAEDENLLCLLANFSRSYCNVSKNPIKVYAKWHEVADMALCALELSLSIHVDKTKVASDHTLAAFVGNVRATTVPPADPMETFPLDLLNYMYNYIIAEPLYNHIHHDSPSYLCEDIIRATNAVWCLGDSGVPIKLWTILTCDCIYLCQYQGATEPVLAIPLECVRVECEDDTKLCTIRFLSMMSGHPFISIIHCKSDDVFGEVQVPYLLCRYKGSMIMEGWLDLLSYYTWQTRRNSRSPDVKNYLLDI